MRNTLLITSLLALLFSSSPPAVTPRALAATASQAADALPPVASYTIDVTLDKPNHLLSGHEVIRYRNASSVAIGELGWHLYLNAFRDANTLFMRESGGQSRGFPFDPQDGGWIEVKTLSLADGTPLPIAPRESVMTTTLPAALAPGAVLTLTLDFQSKLPLVFARTGYAGDFVMAGQWFPKLAVHDDQGWHNFEFHANSEFYADFGDYDVTLHVPAGDVTGATGLPDGAPAVSGDTQTVHYRAENVIDFAWTSSPNYKSATRDADGVEVLLLYQTEHESFVQDYLDVAAKALRAYAAKYAPYPYKRLTIVDPPDDAPGAGGMEYPMLVTGGNAFTTIPIPGVEAANPVAAVTAHEIGHEWFGMTAASNEAFEPWLDEGFTTFVSDEFMDETYGQHSSSMNLGFISLGARDQERAIYGAMPEVSMGGRAWDYGSLQYGIAAYSKPSLALTTLKGILGPDTFSRVMQTYYQRYRFRHPTTADFRKVLEEVSGKDMSAFFDQVVYGTGTLDDAVSNVSEHEVVVRSLGQVTLPATLQVTFADGSTRTEQWDGSAQEQRYDYPQAVVTRATLDPYGLFVLDIDASNNARAAQVVPGALNGLADWFFWMQTLLLALGGQQ